jgi:hypothetical protein
MYPPPQAADTGQKARFFAGSGRMSGSSAITNRVDWLGGSGFVPQ